jgi:hypothetical protein
VIRGVETIDTTAHDGSKDQVHRLWLRFTLPAGTTRLRFPFSITGA